MHYLITSGTEERPQTLSPCITWYLLALKCDLNHYIYKLPDFIFCHWNVTSNIKPIHYPTSSSGTDLKHEVYELPDFIFWHWKVTSNTAPVFSSPSESDKDIGSVQLDVSSAQCSHQASRTALSSSREPGPTSEPVAGTTDCIERPRPSGQDTVMTPSTPVFITGEPGVQIKRRMGVSS